MDYQPQAQKLRVLEHVASRYSKNEVYAMPLSVALPQLRSGDNRVAIGIWRDEADIFAGMDWIEYVCSEQGGVRVKRVPVPGMEIEEVLPLDTPVLVFQGD